MPQTLYKEDGSPVEVPTTEEIEAQTEQKLGETKAEYDNRIAEIEKDVNPNWREARKTMAEQETKIKALESQGKTINEKGEIVDLNRTLTMQDVERISEEKAQAVALSQIKGTLLSKYDAETRPVVEKYFNKLTQGEKLDDSNISTFISDAERAAGLSSSKNRAPVFSGQSPIHSPSESFAETVEGKTMMSQLFPNRK
jgi:hypothetical protein